MSQEDIEETIETTEEQTSVEETQEENQQGSSLEEANKRLYARTKLAEEEVKKLKEALKNKQETTVPEEVTNKELDPFDTIELINTLKDFDNDELSFIKTVAKGSGKSLKEAAVSEDVKLYVEARREKIRKDNLTLDPSNKHSNPNLTAEDALAKGYFKSSFLS